MISNLKFKISNSEKGFTMVELIVTVAIFSFGIVGVYAAFSSMLKANYNITARFTAAYLAQEGLEVIRNIRDANFITLTGNPGVQWSDGLLSCQVGCQGDYKTGTAAAGSQDQLSPYDAGNVLRLDASGLYGYEATGQATPFTRKITITQVSADILHVDVAVFWNYSGEQFNAQTEAYLYRWY